MNVFDFPTKRRQQTLVVTASLMRSHFEKYSFLHHFLVFS